MSKNLSFPSKPFRTSGGARVPHRKNTADVQSIMMPSPKTVTIPMQQHIGAPCKPVVAVGDAVNVGTVIGDSEAFVCAPIHSSVSGTVKSIIKLTLPGGATADAVVIESDGLDTPDPAIKPPVVENVQDFLKAVRASGLVGLGGAGFPAHVKLNVPEGKKIDTLLINCAECEPYITADNREVIENSWAVMSGVYSVLEILGIDRVIIGVENNKPEAIKILREIADNEQYDSEDRVRILPLKASYPQGAEKVLIKACTGREVPAGKLPADAGCIVMNVTSIAFLSDYLKTGMPLTKKRLTIDGSAVKEPKNVIVPIGTPINAVMEFCGGYKCEPKKILMGGPMMGLAVSDDTIPVLKQNNAILAFDEKEARLSEATDCIRCGRCVDACPMRLVPTKLCADIKLKDFDSMLKHQLMTCMECGSCAYSCPAHRHIVQTIRMGKRMLRAHIAKEKEAKK